MINFNKFEEDIKNFSFNVGEKFGIAGHDLPWYNDQMIVTSINLPSIYLEEEITRYKSGGKSGNTLILDVRGNEGDRVPHFHFYTNDHKIDGCVSIYNAEYFPHRNHKSKLTNKETKILNYILSQRESPDDKTYWEKIKEYWNHAKNNKKVFSLINKQPDYSKLNKPVSE